MNYVRCKCEKIVAQLEGRKVVVKCRHCKRFVVIDLDTIQAGETVIQFREANEMAGVK
ncbi:MAG: hypothetical protein M1598_08205 [Actinobacteria bacterium]|nr:hypothetical protein [Actinomycetota bacterium]